VFGIISRNGAQHVKSKPRFLSRKFPHLHSRPTTLEELFNLHHSQARNCVERIFGIIKRQFGVFSHAPEYPIETQAKLVPAITALHNFFCIHDCTDEASPDDVRHCVLLFTFVVDVTSATHLCENGGKQCLRERAGSGGDHFQDS
jgi:hypothetical protein